MNQDIKETEEILNDEELIDEPKLPPEPTALEENEAQMDIEPPKNGLLGVASKALINKLLKRKIIIIAAVGVAILFFLIVFSAASNSSGANDYQYVKGLCDSVTITYEPYDSDETTTDTMDIEDYVASATYEYTKDFIEEKDSYFHVYKSLAIALRTEAIANNCQVTYKDKTLSPKPSSGKNMKVLDLALTAASHLITTVKGEDDLLPVKVSDFCYQQNDGTNYTIFQVPDFTVPTSWVEAKIANEIYRDCPCNQPNEELEKCWSNYESREIPEDFIGPLLPEQQNTVKKKKWKHEDDTTGYNVYAALYLLEEYGLNADSLLKYFIGFHDIKTTKDPNSKEETNTNSNTSTLCESFDLFSTSLSRSEFASKLKNYKGTSSSPGLDLFKKYAEQIYDIATKNGVNPEFIVARAVSEGFSPGTSNNYWGVGCTNTGGGADCKEYSSNFEQAIVEYCNYITSTYKDMNDLLRRYAFLGQYWYNPGSWSVGGCAYKDSIFPDGIPDRVQKACASGNTCSVGGGGNCVQTTEEEQTLYGKWQNRKMLETRKEIWGLDENDCSSMSNGQCKIFKQNDPIWGKDLLLRSPSGSTLGSAGCAVTSISIAMTCSGKLKDPDNFTPRVLNNALKPYTPDGLAHWSDGNWKKIIEDLAPGFHYSEYVALSGTAKQKAEQIAAAKKPNNQLILHLSNAEHATHYVVYSSADGEYIETMDPAPGTMFKYYAGDFNEMQIYSY